MLKPMSEQEFNEKVFNEMYSFCGLPALPPGIFELISEEDQEKITKLHQDMLTEYGRNNVKYELSEEEFTPEIKMIGDRIFELGRKLYPYLEESGPKSSELNPDISGDEINKLNREISNLQKEKNDLEKIFFDGREKEIISKYSKLRKEILSKYNIKFKIGNKTFVAE